jgi:hypothetical protein
VSEELSYRTYVYELCDPLPLYEERSLLRTVIFSGISIDKDSVWTVAPASGWIYFAQASKIFSSARKTALLQTADEVHSTAEAFFAAANTRIGQNTTLAGRSVLPVFPEKRFLKEDKTEPVLNPDTGVVDHWLCRYRIVLPSSVDFREAKANVIGAGLDVRIGNRGEILGFHLRWRPYVKKQETAFAVSLLALTLADWISSATHGHCEEEHDHEEEDHIELDAETWDALNIVYIFQGANSEQTHFAPFVPKAAGHHFGYLPVSTFSLAVSIAPMKQSGNTRTVYAIVFGGSGQYEYDWGAWYLNGRDSGIHTSSSSSFIELPIGMHQVTLYLKDKITGVTTTTGQIMLVKELSEEELIS